LLSARLSCGPVAEVQALGFALGGRVSAGLEQQRERVWEPASSEQLFWQPLGRLLQLLCGNLTFVAGQPF